MMLSPSTTADTPCAAADLDDLRTTVDMFRRRYDTATDAAAAELDRDWDTVWAHSARAAVEEVLRPDADVPAVRARLAALLRAWRRALLDPVRLYTRSLFVQEVVHAGIASVEAWCDENKPDEAGRCPAEPAYAAEWRVMLAHPAVFDGYALSVAGPEPGAFRFRPPVNLYGARGPVHLRLPRTPYDPLDHPGRRRLLLAAVGETLRYGDPVHRRYIRAIVGRHGATVDAESVARERCGYPAFACVRDVFEDSHAEWRRPVAAAEQAMARLLAAHDFVLPLLAEWLRDHAGCGPQYVGVRFPPAFGALLADLFGEAVADAAGGPVPAARWDRAAADRAACVGAEADIRQSYDRWIEFGVLQRPDRAVLTRGWDTADLATLEDHAGVFSESFRAAWRLNRGGELTG